MMQLYTVMFTTTINGETVELPIAVDETYSECLRLLDLAGRHQAFAGEFDIVPGTRR